MTYDPTTWNHEDVITSQKLNKIEKGLTDVAESAIFGFGGAQQSSDGLTPFSYINAGDPMPSNPKKGDTVFINDGNDFTIYSYDGEQWNIKVDPKLSERTQTTLDKAKTDTADLINKNNHEIKSTIDEVAQEKIDLALKEADFNANAQAMADKALADAKTNTAQVAQETLNSANRNLADAKKSLTESIDKEVSDRASAVDAANSQAQTYANQAKADALNTIAKEVTDRQNAVSELNTKATNAVNQAKSDINDTINAISAGDRNYILDTANPKTQMSNGNDNQDLYDKANFYKSLDQWAKTDTQYKISFDWNLKTVLTNDMMLTLIINQAPWQNFTVTIPANKLSGHVDITFILWNSMISAKPTGITFRINSQMSSGNTITYYNLFMKSGTITTDWTPAPEDVVLDYTTKDNKIKETITQYQDTNDRHVSKLQTDATTALGQVATKVSQTDYDQKTGDLSSKYTQVKQTADSQATDIVDIKKTATSQASKINSISSDVDGTKQSISDIEKTQHGQSDKINQITNDVNGTKQSITDIQTKDGKQDARMGTIETSVSGVKSDFSSYKTTNDGVVKTAQSTAQTAVDGLKTKVSQTDYNKKTGQLQTDLTTTTQTANEASAAVGKLTSADGIITKVQADIKVNADAITKKVSKEVYDQKNDEILRNTNEVKDTADKALRTIGDYKTSNDNRVHEAESNIERTANSITEKVSKTDYDNDKSKLNERFTKVEKTADGVSSIVSDPTKGLSVRIQTAEGTLNTVKSTADGAMSKASQTANDIKQEISDRKTGDSNTLQSSKDFTQSTITSYDKGIQSQFTLTSAAILAKVGATNLFPNSEFTQHYGYEGSGEVYLSGGEKANVDNKYSGTVSVTSTASYWQGYWANKIPVSGGQKYSASVLVHYTNGGLSNGSAGLDIWFYDNKGVRISSASRWTSQVSSPFWVKLSNEGFTAPNNAVSVQVSLLVVGAGQVATFTQPMLTATEKLQEYTPNDDISSQLSLLKDNWSIGITDNIGKITSGIVGNASQMSIISKNVTIDSPNTQITGTAWIQSAMIANGAIGSAQIGDATITSAKIAQLDVAKLTGNTTNFIKSNWASAYGNVSITSTNITLQSYSGTSLMTELNISDLGMTMKIPGISSFLDSTVINANGMSFQHNGGSYATVGVMDAGFTLEHNQLGGSPMSIRIGDGGTPNGGTNSANDMAFAISAAQDNGTAPQLIWAGSRVGKVSSKYRTWNNPQGFILTDNIKFSTWDDTPSKVEIDDTVNFYNYAPIQVYGQRFSDGTTRSLHMQGTTLSNGHKWYGFFDANSLAGFGTDDTHDVLFYVAGKSYSLYTMLHKLNMY